jgi:hypothetical protein
MKYKKTIDSILRGSYSRADLVKLRANAAAMYAKGDEDAKPRRPPKLPHLWPPQTPPPEIVIPRM